MSKEGFIFPKEEEQKLSTPDAELSQGARAETTTNTRSHEQVAAPRPETKVDPRLEYFFEGEDKSYLTREVIALIQSFRIPHPELPSLFQSALNIIDFHMDGGKKVDHTNDLEAISQRVREIAYARYIQLKIGITTR